MTEPSTRRRLLEVVAGGGALVASGALAGCTSSPGEGTTDDGTMDDSTTELTGDGATTSQGSTTTEDRTASTTESGAATTSGGSTGTQPETGAGGSLDLREANVVGVAVSPTDAGIRFDVTLHHDDDGEEGYADWWVVETLEGTEVGRRDLTHAHCTCEFTREATIEIPDGTECVVIRGHDQTHGYGGRAAIVSLNPSDVTFVDQGPEPTSFADAECP